MEDKHKLVSRYIEGHKKQIKKDKLRKARKKLGTKANSSKTRQKKVHPADWDSWDDWDEYDFDTTETIISKDEAQRRREIEKQYYIDTNREAPTNETDPKEVDVALNILNDTHGLVIETSSGLCRVKWNNETLLCDIRGNVRDADTGYVNPVAVGDQVSLQKTGARRGIVESVLPRRSVLARPYSPDAGKQIAGLEQIMVANVDRLLIVASWREPNLWPALIDRYLIAAQRNRIEALICINKIDLVTDPTEFDEITQTYQNLGYPLLTTSTISGRGIPELQNLLKNSTTVLAGLSGVGKSSLLTAVQPSLDLKTGAVSEKGLFSGQGRHTTTQTNLWELDQGGIVVDTPGVRAFALAGIAPQDLADWYPEFFDYAQNCRFANCNHGNEPDCAVQEAVQNGQISPIRYKSYTQIYAELSA